MIKYNRKQYLANECDHHTYYAQFVTPGILSLVSRRIGLDRIKGSIRESFNDIPLIHWDLMHTAIGSMVGPQLGESNASMTAPDAGRGYSLSDTVCVAKVAAQMLKETAELCDTAPRVA